MQRLSAIQNTNDSTVDNHPVCKTLCSDMAQPNDRIATNKHLANTPMNFRTGTCMLALKTYNRVNNPKKPIMMATR